MRLSIPFFLCCAALFVCAVGYCDDSEPLEMRCSLSELQDIIWQQDQVGMNGNAMRLRRLLIQRFPDARPECAQARLEIGDYHRNKGQIEAAIKDYTKVYMDYPEQDVAAAEALFSRAFCEMFLKRFQNARDSLQRLFDLYSWTEGVNIDEAQKLYGDVLMQLDLDQAIAHFRQIADDPIKSGWYRAYALTMVGYAYFKKSDDNAALACFERCRVQYPEHADDARFSMCALLAIRKDIPAALAIREELAHSSPLHERVASAYIQFEMGGLAAAVPYLESATEAAPRAGRLCVGEAFNDLYSAQLALGNALDAEKTKRRWAHLDPMSFRGVFAMTDREFAEYCELAGGDVSATPTTPPSQLAGEVRPLSDQEMSTACGGFIGYGRVCYAALVSCAKACWGYQEVTDKGNERHLCGEGPWWMRCWHDRQQQCGTLITYGSNNCQGTILDEEPRYDWGCAYP